MGRACGDGGIKAVNDILAEQVERVAGLYTGMCQPEEYEHLIAAGLLRKSFDGPGGFLGMSKLERVREEMK